MVGINLIWYTLSLMLSYNEPNHKWCGILKGKLRVFDGVIFWGNTFHYLFQEGMMKLHLPKVKVLNVILHSDSWSVLLYIHPDMYGLLWWLQMPVCACMCVCICTHVHTYVCMYVCMCICYVCMYVWHFCVEGWYTAIRYYQFVLNFSDHILNAFISLYW